MRQVVNKLIRALLLLSAGRAALNCELCFGQTADEILERSRAAMAPPIKFKLNVNGEVMEVYEKLLPPNLLAKKTVPKRKGVYFLALEKDVFEIHEFARVVIDKGLMDENLKAASLSSLGEGERSGLSPRYSIAEELLDGVACWKLSQALDAQLVIKAASVLTKYKVENVPCEIETFIARNSYKKVGSIIRYENGVGVTGTSVRTFSLKPKCALSDLALQSQPNTRSTKQCCCSYCVILNTIVSQNLRNCWKSGKGDFGMPKCCASISNIYYR
ncbi:MAG: hypothetical protein LW870_24560 [Pirellula sp.]|nr:hypothetical protein [Pirellula sp.]